MAEGDLTLKHHVLDLTAMVMVWRPGAGGNVDHNIDDLIVPSDRQTLAARYVPGDRAGYRDRLGCQAQRQHQRKQRCENDERAPVSHREPP
jgi:hypothetical protein